MNRDETHKAHLEKTTAPDTQAPMRIRLANPDDAAGVLAVYAPFITTPITFEETLPALDDFHDRMEGIVAKYPYLVAEREGSIVGYAYAHEQAERDAYAWNAELSVYLAPEAQGSGLGSILYRALLTLLRLQGAKCAYALVTLPNEASERLQRSFGFELMGIQKNAGYSCGAWHDVAWYTLDLGAFDNDPTPVAPFPELFAKEPEAVTNVLDHANGELETRASSQRRATRPSA